MQNWFKIHIILCFLSTSSFGQNSNVISGKSALKHINYSNLINIEDIPCDSTNNEDCTRNYLIVIAANKYKNNKYWPNLKYAIKDTKDVIKVLFDRYNFDDKYTHELYDHQFTLENIETLFRNLITVVRSTDNVIVYYAGHGFYDKTLDEGYWVPHPATRSTTEYLSNATLMKYISALQAKHVLIIADACFSGSLYTQKKRGSNMETHLSKKYIDKVYKIKSRWLLASGRGLVDDKMPNKENSPFANYLIDYLSKKQTSFPAPLLFQNVKEKVTEHTDQIPLAAPLKDAGDMGGEFVISDCLNCFCRGIRFRIH